MQPLYLARIEDLGCGDLLRVDCAATWRCSGPARASPNGHGVREGSGARFGDYPPTPPLLGAWTTTETAEAEADFTQP
jgi:hypothetical protein